MTTWWPAAATSAVLATGYLGALLARPAHLRPWSGLRTVAWLVGAVLVGVALSPPLAEHAQHDHGAHMAQHLLLGMYAPLGLVLGAPLTLVLGSAPRAAAVPLVRVLRSRPVHALSHPVTAAALSTGGLFALYLTPLYELTRSSTVVHGLVLAHLLLAGCLYTWAIAGPDPAPRRPGTTVRVATLVVAAGAHAFLAKLLYADAVRTHADGTHHGAAMTDAAQAMYYGGDGAELLLAVALFAWWYRRGGTRAGRSARAAPTAPSAPAVPLR
ncbi:cytochrome c oxidase assembly protein [Actinotalea ferrariae]|uniref:cytochrome c oxidase assembly protein n=1 Tax=Actinotalea ferrariae TaxID=1386098 RepID=UPI001C8C8B16|nr:cytochrome c oxidase assembly protein [Actinotalea ferrariae]MBX9245386.1 cytochrome c oxidase assembly protein [Actinotalea ferrariae]